MDAAAPAPTPSLEERFEVIDLYTAYAETINDDGLFLDPASNKNTGIVSVLMRLAEAADEARRR